MILLNPYYVFSNVIFINPEKKFIMIELPVYRKIHSIIFKGKNSTPKQRRLLRKLFYNTYFDYFYRHIEIDHSAFNNSLKMIYDGSSVVDFDHTTIVEESEGETVFKDLEIFAAAKVDGTEKIWEEESSERKSLDRALSLKPEFDSNINAEVNQLALQNSDYNLLVNFFGMGKILNMFRNIICFDQFRIKDEFEYKFIYHSLTFLAKYRLRNKDRKFDFICNDCMNVGTHYINTRSQVKFGQEVVSCYLTEWFSYNGIIPNQKHSDSLMNKQHNMIFEDMNTKYEHNSKNIILLSSRNDLQIGACYVNQDTKEDYDAIIEANHNRFRYIEKNQEIEVLRNESEGSRRGIFAHIIQCDSIIMEINSLKQELENPFDHNYMDKLNRYFELHLEMFKIQNENAVQQETEFSNRFKFGVQSKAFF